MFQIRLQIEVFYYQKINLAVPARPNKPSASKSHKWIQLYLISSYFSPLCALLIPTPTLSAIYSISLLTVPLLVSPAPQNCCLMTTQTIPKWSICCWCSSESREADISTMLSTMDEYEWNKNQGSNEGQIKPVIWRQRQHYLCNARTIDDALM